MARWPGRKHVLRDARGRVLVRLAEYADGRRVVQTGAAWPGASGADRERAAAWLADWFESLTHDQRYELLMGGVF